MTWPHGGGSQSSVEVHGPIQADQKSSFVRVIITGANSGVGRASAAVPASAGHDVVIACRNRVKGKEAATGPEQGARSTLQAVTSDLPNGAYLAPRGLLQLWGQSRIARVHDNARDPAAARRLWDASAELTGCDWPGD
jgi:NAD(P)-dependent dehydrogenase (short-subunit alcohol dehydrogenase family)